MRRRRSSRTASRRFRSPSSIQTRRNVYASRAAQPPRRGPRLDVLIPARPQPGWARPTRAPIRRSSLWNSAPVPRRPRTRSTTGAVLKAPKSSLVYLVGSGLREPCGPQKDRRRVLFSQGTAGSGWARRGPSPQAMRNKTIHNCRRS